MKAILRDRSYKAIGFVMIPDEYAVIQWTNRFFRLVHTGSKDPNFYETSCYSIGEWRDKDSSQPQELGVLVLYPPTPPT